jgi:hypothetical protein
LQKKTRRGRTHRQRATDDEPALSTSGSYALANMNVHGPIRDLGWNVRFRWNLEPEFLQTIPILIGQLGQITAWAAHVIYRTCCDRSEFDCGKRS